MAEKISNMENGSPDVPYFTFEIAWEVANKGTVGRKQLFSTNLHVSNYKISRHAISVIENVAILNSTLAIVNDMLYWVIYFM